MLTFDIWVDSLNFWSHLWWLTRLYKWSILRNCHVLNCNLIIDKRTLEITFTLFNWRITAGYIAFLWHALLSSRPLAVHSLSRLWFLFWYLITCPVLRRNRTFWCLTGFDNWLYRARLLNFYFNLLHFSIFAVRTFICLPFIRWLFGQNSWLV